MWREILIAIDARPVHLRLALDRNTRAADLLRTVQQVCLDEGIDLRDPTLHRNGSTIDATTALDQLDPPLDDDELLIVRAA